MTMVSMVVIVVTIFIDVMGVLLLLGAHYNDDGDHAHDFGWHARDDGEHDHAYVEHAQKNGRYAHELSDTDHAKGDHYNGGVRAHYCY